MKENKTVRVNGLFDKAVKRQASHIWDKEYLSPKIDSNGRLQCHSLELKEIRLGNLFNATGGNYAGMVYDKQGLAPTFNSMQGGYRQPMIIIKL